MEALLFARVNLIGFKPEALPVAIERYRTATLPMISAWPGYHSALALVQPLTGKVFTTSLWETAEARDESGLRMDYIDDLSSYGEMISGSMAREAYEVVTSTLRPATPEDARGRAWGRVTTGMVPPERWDDAVAVLKPIVEDDGDNRSHQGSMMLINRSLAKIVIVGVWDSRRAIYATDDEVHAQAHMVRRSGYLSSSPIHEIYEVAGWG
jgi:heme-degrading monooxygenase HmoA